MRFQKLFRCIAGLALLATSLGAWAAEKEVKTSRCNWLVEVKVMNTWYERDQGVRMRLTQAMAEAQKRGQTLSKEERDSLNTQMRSDNVKLVAELDDLVSRCGWPTVEEFGENPVVYATLVVQHSPLDVQLRYHPMMKKAAESNDLPFRFFAALEDRIRLFQGRPQLYGTQIVDGTKPGTLKLWKVEDPKRLNERRVAAGMVPVGICSYLDMFTPKPSYAQCEEKGKKIPG